MTHVEAAWMAARVCGRTTGSKNLPPRPNNSAMLLS